METNHQFLKYQHWRFIEILFAGKLNFDFCGKITEIS